MIRCFCGNDGNQQLKSELVKRMIMFFAQFTVNKLAVNEWTDTYIVQQSREHSFGNSQFQRRSFLFYIPCVSKPEILSPPHHQFALVLPLLYDR